MQKMNGFPVPSLLVSEAESLHPGGPLLHHESLITSHRKRVCVWLRDVRVAHIGQL